MWASRASLETWGRLTSAAAIDFVMPTFGDIMLIPMSTLLMFSTLPSFEKQCVVVLVSITSTKLVFLGTISRVVLTLNLLGLTTLDIDAPPPQLAGPGPQGFWPDPHMFSDPTMRLSNFAVSWWSLC